MEKQAFEQSGLIPRSIIRTFDRFRKQLLPGAENNVIQEFRISRYQVLISVKSLLALIVIPFLMNFLLKSLLLTPLTEFFWNNYQSEIFLNSYQQKHALKEIQNFEEKIYFETLIDDNFFEKTLPILKLSDPSVIVTPYQPQSTSSWSTPRVETLISPTIGKSLVSTFSEEQKEDYQFFNENNRNRNEFLKKRFQQKTIEIAFQYNQQSILAITNIFCDFFTFLTIFILFIVMKPQIIILKSFLTESIYSLSDTTKSFLLIFVTDLLVGFHSPRGWDLVLEIFFQHFGLPENKDFILLFVATFPVLLDTVFKYWIFRYLNKISPSTVATYHNMIE